MVVDRIVIRPDMEQRLADSIATALGLADGIAVAEWADVAEGESEPRRLLWARVGIPYSPATGLPIESQTVSQMVDKITALAEGTRLYLLAPVIRGRKGEYRKEIGEWQRAGYQRLKMDGEV